MTCFKNSPKCSKTVYDICVESQLELPSFTTIEDTECVNIKDIHEDLYSLIGTIKDEIDLSEIDAECLTIPAETKVNQLFQILITVICENQALIQVLQSELEIAQEQIADLQQNNCP